jgi:hypothetical protein
MMERYNISPEEEKFCHYKLGIEGSFSKGLYDVFFIADIRNRAKLMAAFPHLEVAYRYSQESGYWQDLMNRWNEAHPHHKIDSHLS